MTSPELGVQLLRHGYQALARNAETHQDERQYEARLAGRRALVVWGSEGARLFYDQAFVGREGAVPPPLARLLFGKGAVHGLDGPAHAVRKQLFLDVLTTARVEELAGLVRERLAARLADWAEGEELCVFQELVELYGVSVLEWAGLELPLDRSRDLSRELARIVDGFGGAGRAFARGAVARRRLNRWAADLVGRVRAGELAITESSPLGIVALGTGAGLDDRTAGVELLNILRPTVAVSWPGTFAVLALAVHSQWRGDLADDQPGLRRAFAQEVRRTAPFAPALAARVRQPGVRRGFGFEAGDFLVLDVLGTNHDPARWPDPVRFDPHRFLDEEPGPFDLVPQGGGDPRTGHRCPGEAPTLRLLEETVGAFAGTELELASDPSYDPRRVPTLPRDGLRVRRLPG